MMAQDRAIAMLTAFCEASGEGPEARRGVIWSMRNRRDLDPSRYGSTLAAVCLKRAQYSEWDGDSVDNRNLERAATCPDSDPVMLDCGLAYDEMISGHQDPTNGATHFYAKSIPAPYWTAQATLCATLGNLLFWKDVP